MDAARLAFPDAQFDAIYALYVVNVVPDRVKVAREMLRVFRPAGRLVLLNHFDDSGQFAIRSTGCSALWSLGSVSTGTSISTRCSVMPGSRLVRSNESTSRAFHRSSCATSPGRRGREENEPQMTFLDALAAQRWDDHRFYHHSRINQALHLFSALMFLCSYGLLFVEPAAATILAWIVAMPSRQIGHFFFEPPRQPGDSRAQRRSRWGTTFSGRSYWCRSGVCHPFSCWLIPRCSGSSRRITSGGASSTTCPSCG
jgi:SAM-dependent methyltransferase